MGANQGYYLVAFGGRVPWPWDWAPPSLVGDCQVTAFGSLFNYSCYQVYSCGMSNHLLVWVLLMDMGDAQLVWSGWLVCGRRNQENRFIEDG